ncbi:MAG: glycoside hydrolase family 3 C-terminal domain-containing protein [Tenericutes bacterium]|nr:glycoside hydrolase family 3 C-terminal domain-containing protein [Mycoplasmatota bacterium]
MSEKNDLSLKELLDKLTIKEKVGQLLQIAPFLFIKDLKVEVAGHVRNLKLDEEKIFCAGSVLGIGSPKEMIAVQKKYLAKSRHKIPLLFMADVIHGYKSIFPVPIALASSFNPKMAEITARISAVEASSCGINVTFSPMVDLSRDPRWGRVMEGFGEDPYLISKMGKAMVKGYMGDGLDKSNSLASCVKHFAGYGAAIAGRDYNTVDLSRLALYSEYLPPYKAAIDAGARLIMTAFNTIDGVPSTVNSFLLRTILRDKWHCNAVTISDFDSLRQIITHGVAKDTEEVAYKGITNGLDIEMASSTYANHLEDLINRSLVDIKLLDEAVLRILDLKKDLGLFDNPYKGVDEIEDNNILTKDNLNKTLETAYESMVLLENDGVLPLNKNVKIALIGPYATSRSIIGPWSWHGSRDTHKCLEEVLRDNLVFCKDEEDVSKYTESDLEKIKQADVVILAIGEPDWLSGEAHSRTDITIPNNQDRLLTISKELGIPSVVLLFNGRPLIIDSIKSSNALLECWFLGSESSTAIKDVLFGKINPSGKLPMTFPRSVGQIPIYYNHLNTGRPYLGENDHNQYVSKYLDSPNTPLYSFGYGLSYCKFEYSNLQLTKNTMNPKESITASVEVKNNSDYAGYEVVQLYIKDHFARISRPVKELKNFKKIHFLANEKKIIDFIISIKDLTYITETDNEVYDSGSFSVMIGGSSDHTLIKDLELVKELS